MVGLKILICSSLLYLRDYLGWIKISLAHLHSMLICAGDKSMMRTRHQETAMPLALTWLDATTWQVTLTLVPGLQNVTLEAQDHAGSTVATLPLMINALP